MEIIFERAPEVIIDTSDNGRGALRGRSDVGPWDRWPFLPAVERAGSTGWTPSASSFPAPACRR